MSIGQGPSRTEHLGSSHAAQRASSATSSTFIEEINRGYNDQNSYSRRQQEDSSERSFARVPLELPDPEADIEKGQELLHKLISSGEGFSVSDSVDEFARRAEAANANEESQLPEGADAQAKPAKSEVVETGTKDQAIRNGAAINPDDLSLESKDSLRKSSDSSGETNSARNTPESDTARTPSAERSQKAPADANVSANANAESTASANQATSNTAPSRDPQINAFLKGELTPLGKAVGANSDPNHFYTALSSNVRLAESFAGGNKLNTAFNKFEDIVIHYQAITDIPPEVKTRVDASIKTFVDKALSKDPVLDTDTAITLLTQIQSELQHNRIEFNQEQIRVKKDESEHQTNEKIEKIRESIEKQKEAQETSLAMKIFGWLAVIFMAIITAVAAVVTGGAATGLMVAALAITITMQVSNEAGSTWMMDMFGNSEDAKIGAMVFWSALIIALSLGAAAAGGAAGAGSAAGSTASNASSAGATVSATAANATSTGLNLSAKTTAILTKISQVTQLVNGATLVADGATTIVNANQNYDADILRAEARQIQAYIQRNQQAIDDLAEALERAIEDLQSGYTSLTNIIRDNHDTKTTISRNLRA